MRHFYRYRICLPASTSVYTYTHTRAKILSHRVSIFSIFFLSFQQFESLKKMAINHRGIDNVLLDIYIYIYTSDETSIIWPSGIPRSAHLFRILGTGIQESTLRHWRTNDDTKPGATAQTIYFMSFPPPPSSLPLRPRADDRPPPLLMPGCVYTSRRSPAGAT